MSPMPLPPLPDIHALAVLALTVLALYVFTRPNIPLESSSLFVLVAVVVGFALFPYTTADGERLRAVDFFSGFGHEALVAVGALMIAGQGLVRTGALEPIGRALARLWRASPRLSLLLTLLVGALLSAFVNNVPVVVLLLPILISVSLRSRTPASGVLMPIGFATLVGGMSTTIGTSTNLLVVSVAADMGLRRFEMFDFFLPVAVSGALAILYLWLVAPRLLPERKAHMTDTSPRVFAAQLGVVEGSFADGKTLAEVLNRCGGGMRVSGLRRQGTMIVPLPDAELRAGDRLLIKDTPEQLKEYETVLGATLYSGDTPVDDEHPLVAENQQLAEIVVVQGSPLEHTTLRRIRFAERYQLITLALHRAGWNVETLRTEVGDVSLVTGDVLLVQGAQDQIAQLKRSGELLVLDATSDLPHSSKAPVALSIMAAIVLVAALGLVPIAVSATCGVLLMVATGCLSWRDATLALSAQVVLIVVASLALGAALVKTGGADYLAQLFVAATFGAPPSLVLAGLMLLMALLTNVVSNNAAAVIGTPIAIGIAAKLGVHPEAFVLAVLFGANMSYATPMAYKTNLLVMNAGGYTFSDFLRVGVPLTFIQWLALSWLLTALFPL
ncbi:MAG: SLC13 family permease [Deferrisomatales bacterium]|nr:SLC13 family permease [Deferrisomatales bacterium]